MIQQSPIANSQQKSNHTQKSVNIKRIFQLGTSLGKLMLQVNYFGKYFFVIVTYASLLKIDGPLQISYPIPNDSKPIVLNLIQGLTASDEMTRRLSKQLGMPLILSLNIESQTNKKGEEQLFQGILKICKSFFELN